jgi:hypothetical protein
MGKKGNGKVMKKKMTKKEKKQQNHLRLIQGQKDSEYQPEKHNDTQYKKAS